MSDEEKGAVHVYVDDATHDAFTQYLKQVGLRTNTALLDLLTSRELKLERLRRRGFISEPSCTGHRKISGYLGSDRRRALDRHVSSLSARECLSRLIRLELDEKWLLRALEWNGQ